MGPLPGKGQNPFPYSIRGFIAEPSQSANVRSKIPRPSNPADPVCRKGRRCVFFFAKARGRVGAAPRHHAVRPRALNGDAGRVCSALSSNSSGSRPFKPRDAGATPVRAANFLKEAPVLDPRSEFALPYRIPMKPAGGPSPAGAEFTCARVA